MKTLTLLLAICTVSAQAVSFQWSSSAPIKFGTTTLSTTSAQATAYLVYLGTDGAWSFGEDTKGTLANVTDSYVGDPVLTKTVGNVNTKGTYTGTYGKTENQGFSYSVMLAYNDGTDVWFNMSSDVFTVDASLLDNATGVATTFATANTINSTGVEKLSSAQVGNGWYKIAPVPEPATGALALAGIALLFKRRKARA